MIDHTQMFVPAADHKAVVTFYEAALKPLGYKKLLAFGPNEESVGFGDNEFAHHSLILSVRGPKSPEKTT
ncbi:hypothetical protein Daus18300_008829 [Diaporthe australafricana]|uniref:Glyoxalase/bleomycin resistance protein/dioxygenase n=1 Tax=Diaporthe australafricana TaxID=127596 RepID=A0ABR3WGR1_9PEZI